MEADVDGRTRHGTDHQPDTSSDPMKIIPFPSSTNLICFVSNINLTHSQ